MTLKTAEDRGQKTLKMMNITGISHIHSAYSYDSEFSLSRIKEILIQRGYRFGIICDHQKDFDDQRFRTLSEECAGLSDNTFCLIPGLEFEFGSVHILGVGMSSYFDPEDIAGCLDGIGLRNGLSVWAHPSLKDLNRMNPYLHLLNGVEVWSARYGSKYAPSVSLCSLIKNLTNVFAYAGVDAHREDQAHDLYLKMEVEKIEEGAILAELKAGRYSLNFAKFQIPATAELSLLQKIMFPVLLKGYKVVDGIVDVIKED